MIAQNICCTFLTSSLPLQSTKVQFSLALDRRSSKRQKIIDLHEHTEAHPSSNEAVIQSFGLALWKKGDVGENESRH